MIPQAFGERRDHQRGNQQAQQDKSPTGIGPSPPAKQVDEQEDAAQGRQRRLRQPHREGGVAIWRDAVIEKGAPLNQVGGPEVAAVVEVTLRRRAQLHRVQLRHRRQPEPGREQHAQSQRQHPPPQNPPLLLTRAPGQRQQVQQRERREHSRR